jgi:hypothetical protein
MYITSWKAVVELEACEGTTPSNQSIKINGSKCEREMLGEKVKEAISSALHVLGNAEELRKTKDALEKATAKLSALEAANKAFAESQNVREEQSQMPMAEAPRMKKHRA